MSPPPGRARAEWSPRACLLGGVACLLAAQALAWVVLAPQRGGQASGSDLHAALPPGEFAGTLLLGGFRGLACDLLWMRASNAKDQGRFYESVALFEVISRIQPRFEQVWEYMAWDMAYNIGHEVEGQDGKWLWFLEGLRTNARGIERNPGSERLLRHLAWMFHHKGDTFHERVEAADWTPLLAPLLARLERRLPAGSPFPPVGPGTTNFQISALLYGACVRLGEAEGTRFPAFTRRMVPLAIELDGNLLRNRGAHRAAMRRYLDALQAWQQVAAWHEQPPIDGQDRSDKSYSRDSYEQNEGRLRRKAATIAQDLAADAALGARTAEALTARNWSAARALLDGEGWLDTVNRGRVVWLDEGG